MNRADKVAAFRALHAGDCFVMPNVWDRGGALMMAGLGFKALATTSSGYAHSTGRRDGMVDVDLDESLAYAADICGATDLPVSGDMENGFADSPEGVATCVRRSAEAGLAGLAIEDIVQDESRRAYEFGEAVARVEAAAEAAREVDIVLTARADGYLRNVYDLAEAVRRLQAFEEAGAEVLYIPGLKSLDEIRTVTGAVTAPVNHVTGLGAAGSSLADLAAAGVRRISTGGSLARAVMGAMLQAGLAMTEGSFAPIDESANWAEILKAMNAGRPA